LTDPRVDPPLFRHYAFWSDWVAPLEAELADVPSSTSTARLLHALLKETEEWHIAGREIGYFADVRPAWPSGFVEGVDWRPTAVSRPFVVPDALDQVSFARLLTQAREDLTPERREFFRLLCFAEDAEWRATRSHGESRASSDSPMPARTTARLMASE
jgi:hypothetical protein